MLRNEKGYSLLLTIGLIVFISIIGLSLMTINVNSMKTSKHEKVDQSVYYIAEAGINYHVVKVEALIEEAFKETNDAYLAATSERQRVFNFKREFETIVTGKLNSYIATNSNKTFENFKHGSGKQATVKMKYNNFHVYFTSDGQIDNQKRTLKQSLEIKIDDLYEVVSGNSENNVDNNQNEQDISKSSVHLTLKDANNYLNKTYIFSNIHTINGGNFGVGTFTPEEVVNKIDRTLYDRYINMNVAPSSVPVVQASPKMKITKSITLQNFANYKTSINGPFEIDSSNGPITLYIEGDFAPEFTFNVTGGHPVNIIFLGGATFNKDFSLVSPHTEVNMIIPKNRTFNINSGGSDKKLHANMIIGSDTNFDAKNMEVTGSIISLENINLTLNGNANMSLEGVCIPNGNTMVNGKYTIVNGSVVTNKLTINGGGAFDISKANKQNACGTSLFNPPVETYKPNSYKPKQLSVVHTMTEE